MKATTLISIIAEFSKTNERFYEILDVCDNEMKINLITQRINTINKMIDNNFLEFEAYNGMDHENCTIICTKIKKRRDEIKLLEYLLKEITIELLPKSKK